MQATILDGKMLAEQRTAAVREKIESMEQEGKAPPCLAVVLVGDDPASHVYVRNKRRACERTGIRSIAHNLPATTTQEELLELVDQLNHDPEVDGILVQLPLPNGISSNLITNSIAPEKDVDGFHAENMGHLVLRQPGLRPCTPLGVMNMLRDSGVDPKRKHCVVIGVSNHVGRPMILEMLLAGATVTCCHSFTQNLQELVEQAEILVVAVGKPGIIDGNWVRPGAVVVDIGINRLDDGRLVGDVDFDAASARASHITPVPGGVGPMTVVSLMENTLHAAENRNGQS